MSEALWVLGIVWVIAELVQLAGGAYLNRLNRLIAERKQRKARLEWERWLRL